MPKILPIVRDLVLGDRDALALLDVNIINDALSLELDQDFPFDAVLPAGVPMSSYASVIAEQLVDLLNQLQLSFALAGLTPGSGANQILNPAAVATYEPIGYVLVCDSGNHRLQFFDTSFNLLEVWGSAGTSNGQFANGVGPVDAVIESASGLIWVLDPGNARLQRFGLDGGFIDLGLYQRKLSLFQNVWGSTGAATGQFDDPKQAAVNTVGQLFVTDESNNRIQRFSSAGVYQTNVTGVWTAPRGVAIDGGDNLYLADTTSGGRLIKKNSAFTTQWTVIGISGIWNVATDGAEVWVTSASADIIKTYDASTGAFLGDVGGPGTGPGQFDSPLGICHNPTNLHYYVVDQLNDRVQVFTNDGSYDFEFPVGSGPYAIAVNPLTGSLFVTDTADELVREYSPHGVLIRTLAGSGTGNGQTTEATGIAISNDGAQLYLVDGHPVNANRVHRFGLETIVGASTDGGCFNNPRSIANANGFARIFVADPGNARLQVFDYQGGLEAIVAMTGTPLAMAAAPAGNEVYLLMDSGHVTRVTAAGVIIGSWGQAGAERLHDPRGLAVHPGTGHVALLDVDPVRGTVLKEFSPEGVLLQVYGRTGSGNGEFSDPIDLAFWGDGDGLYMLETSRLQQFTVQTRDLTRYDIAVPGWERLVLDPRRPHLSDDFLPITATSGLIGGLGWDFTTSAGGSVTTLTPEAHHPGIIRLNTTGLGSAGEWAQLVLPAYCHFDMLERLRLVTRLGSISTINVVISLQSPSTGRGVHFSFISVFGPRWFLTVTDTSDATVNFDLGPVVVANDWYRLEIVRLDTNSVRISTHNSAGQGGRLIVGGVNFGLETLQPTLFVQSLSAATARTLDIDWFDIHLRQTRT